MKKTDLVKFSLTLVSAAVLAACSSSGKSNKPQVPAQPEEPVTNQPAPAEENKSSEMDVTNNTEATKSGDAFGHKSVVKDRSNLVISGDNKKNSKSSEKLTGMTVELDTSLDTFVVATRNHAERDVAAYLEDFDFRQTTDAAIKASHKSGEVTLGHIHLLTAQEHVTAKTVGKTKLGENNVGVARPDGESRTKTALMGQQEGKALVFQADRKVYVSAHESELNGSQINYYHKDDTDTHRASVRRELTDTVAEVYGNKTFLLGDSRAAQPNDNGGHVRNYAENDVTLSNFPYAHKDSDGFYTKPGVLNYVQYGRVTSALNDIGFNKDLREGKRVAGDGDVRIASYGLYNQAGTENHYFYRTNLTSVTPVNKEDLESTYSTGKVVYNGHAVTYGLDHRYKGKGNVGHAIGGNKKLMSGTHVEATITLADNKVKGSLYDLWSFGGAADTKQVPNVLVKFTGDLNTDNGSIVGKSWHKEFEGTLNANVFGPNIEELGGAVKSNSTDPIHRTGEGSWGAVFGAKATPVPVAPKEDLDSLEDGTDGRNSTAK